jgi:hypothetical protein
MEREATLFIIIVVVRKGKAIPYQVCKDIETKINEGEEIF